MQTECLGHANHMMGYPPFRDGVPPQPGQDGGRYPHYKVPPTNPGIEYSLPSQVRMREYPMIGVPSQPGMEYLMENLGVSELLFYQF